ncbi:MAG TPA: glycosyltransferase family 61 protein [Jatrophihabitantaceae bacterium]|jgi:hypothetical protein|nr:glycosyltransferase family 61 protein [Jatrophihabitantaceae bacterium]
MTRLPALLRPLFPYLKPAYTRSTRVAAPIMIRLSRLRGGYLPQAAVATMELAVAGVPGARCAVARPAEVVTRTLPAGIPALHPEFSENLRERIPRVAVAELPGGRVLGPYRAVITGDGALLHELSFYFGTTRPREHPLFLHPFPPPPREVPGRLGVLAMRGDPNYYHFLMDVLPRLGVLEQCPDIERPARWFVPARTRFQRELLSMFGIEAADRIDSTQVMHVRAQLLVVPGPASMTVINPPWVVAYLRRKLLPVPIARVPGRFIYVTRGEQRNNRRVVNEGELLRMLGERGFRTVDPGAMSVVDQIRAFAEADVIVAPHGAALANLVFASPGACVVELFPPGCAVPDYWKLANGVEGLEYRYLAGTGPVSRPGRAEFLVNDINVDLTALSLILAEVSSTRVSVPVNCRPGDDHG